MQLALLSGGQTGVDRAALDVALELGIPCGGWCPEGRLAEDGVIAPRYPLKVLAGGDYRARTRANVRAADATLIIYFEELIGGTALTLKFCLDMGKPCKLIDGAEVTPVRGGRAVNRFLSRHSVRLLNVAGPRASESPLAYRYTKRLLTRLLAQRIP